MTVTRDQAQMLATLACDVRPTGARQWTPDKVMAEIEKIRDRSLGTVICAVTRAAMDRNAQRPEVISSPGSHWADTMIAQAFVPRTSTAAERCTVCSELETACQMRWAHDHVFESAAMAARRAAGADAERLAAIRATLAPTAGPTERRTLADMAEANPELHARVEAVRAANPGLQAPPMREPEPAEPTEESA
jgi:hypothetical protein